MYFKEKEDTNIDSQFENNNKFSLKNINPKHFIIGGIILFVIIGIISIIILINNFNKYSLELIGADKIVITKGSEYIEPGYKAYDNKNNDVTSKVTIKNNINTSASGSYEIVYSIGNISKVRYIIVDNSNTYIYLTGGDIITLKVGEKYQELGYKVFDSTNSNLTEKVTTSGTVNTSKPGTYKITYSVVTSENITISKVRTVIVK